MERTLTRTLAALKISGKSRKCKTCSEGLEINELPTNDASRGIEVMKNATKITLLICYCIVPVAQTAVASRKRTAHRYMSPSESQPNANSTKQ